MKIWVIAIGEPIPLDDNNDRLHRCGLLNDELVEKGHNVVWWSSTFNHFSKKHLFNERTSISLKANYNIELLHGCSYRRNISFSRIKNHWQVGLQFNESVITYEKPDLIFCAFPSIELAYNATKFAKEKGVPIVIDARDMWPDIFINVVPQFAKQIAKIFLSKYVSMTKYIFSNATSITGITDGFVNWGLKYARREISNNDKSFYLGYPLQEFDENNINYHWSDWNNIGLKKDDFIISYIGAVAQNKIDLDPIFQIATLYKENNKVKFVIAGDGDQKESFANQANQLGLANMFFPGWINKYQIASLFKYTSFGLVPLRNRYDYLISIPNKPIEYIANNVPILSSLSGELKTLIENENIGYCFNNTSELKEIIDQNINKTGLTELKNNCKRVFDKKFNSKIVYPRLVEHLENIFNKY